MNGFFVTISNDLLEDKHFEKMGSAVWLYMWFIDKMTEISEGLGIVNNGNPINIKSIRENFPSISERTYHRMIQVLRDGGYINTHKAQLGLYVTINKPKKHFGNKISPAKNGNTKIKTRQKRSSDLPNMADSPAKNGNTLYIDNNTNTIQDNTTNVVGADAPVVYGKNEINELFNYWQEQTGLGIQAKRQANRNACNNLLKQYGSEGVRKLIDGVVLSLDDQFAPRISDFTDLQAKLNQLLVWGRRRSRSESLDEPLRFGGKK